mgnify:FL=1
MVLLVGSCNNKILASFLMTPYSRSYIVLIQVKVGLKLHFGLLEVVSPSHRGFVPFHTPSTHVIVLSPFSSKPLWHL